jgi:hypothetical protein
MVGYRRAASEFCLRVKQDPIGMGRRAVEVLVDGVSGWGTNWELDVTPGYAGDLAESRRRRE